MHLRSGKTFLPYALERVSWQHPQPELIPTLVDAEPLVQIAAAQEDERFEEGADDSEGLGVSMRPPSPLTESESDEEVTPSDPPPQTASQTSASQTSAPRSVDKKRRNAAANKRRSQKRARIALSGHGPHTYAAKPSTAAHHAEQLKPLQVPVNAEAFPASSSGSWVGKRKTGSKNEPWTLPELLDDGYSVIEWDGR